jgi:single-stranded DNA-binding protein
MIDALISGKLIKTPELKTGQSGKHYTQFLLSVSTGDEQPVIVSGIAFSDVAERIAKLGKGDSLAVIGGLKPTTWQDKATNETKHGLNITVNNSLSVYDIKKRKQTPESSNTSSHNERPFNDDLNF